MASVEGTIQPLTSASAIGRPRSSMRGSRNRRVKGSLSGPGFPPPSLSSPPLLLPRPSTSPPLGPSHACAHLLRPPAAPLRVRTLRTGALRTRAREHAAVPAAAAVTIALLRSSSAVPRPGTPCPPPGVATPPPPLSPAPPAPGRVWGPPPPPFATARAQQAPGQAANPRPSLARGGEPPAKQDTSGARTRTRRPHNAENDDSDRETTGDYTTVNLQITWRTMLRRHPPIRTRRRRARAPKSSRPAGAASSGPPAQLSARRRAEA